MPYCFQIYQTDVCSLPLQTSKMQASKAARSISIDLGPLNAMIRVLQEQKLSGFAACKVPWTTKLCLANEDRNSYSGARPESKANMELGSVWLN